MITWLKVDFVFLGSLVAFRELLKAKLPPNKFFDFCQFHLICMVTTFLNVLYIGLEIRFY